MGATLSRGAPHRAGRGIGLLLHGQALQFPRDQNALFALAIALVAVSVMLSIAFKDVFLVLLAVLGDA